MKERLNKAEFIDRVHRNTVAEHYINQSALSFKKCAELIRCSETNVYIRSRDSNILSALNKSNIKLQEINGLKCFVYQPN